MNVYVHAATLAGWDDRPGELDGHGIIPPQAGGTPTADFARALAASAGTVRVIATQPAPGASPPDTTDPPWTAHGHCTHPVRSRVCGTVLDAGRAVYRPRTATADYVTTRDRISAFTGCRARADTCDLDHRLPWNNGGATCPCNHDPLCRFHHAVKTFTTWRASPGPDGTLTWTSPTGRTYPTEPAHALLDDPPPHNRPTPRGNTLPRGRPTTLLTRAPPF